MYMKGSPAICKSSLTYSTHCLNHQRLCEGTVTCRASLVGLRVRSSSWPMGERPLRMLRGVWGATEPAGGAGDRAPVLLGFPAELALTSGDENGGALFTGALGLGDSCSSCACRRAMRTHSEAYDPD